LVNSKHSADKGSADRGIRVGITASHDGVDDRVFGRLRVEKLPECVSKGD